MADEVVIEPAAPTPSPGADLGSPPPVAGSGLAGPTPTPTPEPTPKPAAPEPVVTPPKAAEPTPKVPTAADVKPDAPKVPTPADFPDDWRQKMAGENKAALKRLERMQSPADVLKSYLALEQKMSSGEIKKALPTHYTAEELAEYKKANGIPDEASGYDTKIDGVVWGEADKPLLDSWTQYAVEKNLTPDVVKMGLDWYSRQQEAMVDQMVARDNENAARGSDALRAELGNNFKPMLNAAQNLYESAPQVEISPGQKADMWDYVMSARDATGKRLGDSPEFLKWQGQLAKELNPYATLVPAGTHDPGKSISDRLGELNRMIGDKSSDYWRGANSDSLQKEWRDLYEANERMGKRVA